MPNWRWFAGCLPAVCLLGCVPARELTLPVETVSWISVDKNPAGFCPGWNPQTLLVSCAGSGTVCEVNLANPSQIRKLEVRSGPGRMVLNPGIRELYCLHNRESALVILGGKPLEVKQQMGFGDNSLVDGAMRPNTSELWIVDGVGAAHVLKTTPLRIKKRINLGRYPQQIAFSESGQKAYVTLKGENAVLELDAQTGAILRRAEVGIYPGQLVLARGKLWVSNFQSNDLSVVDLGEFQERLRIPLRRNPRSLALQGNLLWVACEDSYRVVAIDLDQGMVRGSIQTGCYPGALCALPDGRLAVADRQGHRIGLFRLSKQPPLPEGNSR